MGEGIAQLRKTVVESDIKRVAIVDDVFDPPPLDPDDYAAVLDYLRSGAEVQAEAGIEDAVWAGAIANASAADDDSGDLAEVAEKLYKKYIETGDTRYDPAGIFYHAREANLSYLRPLLEFLGSCESLVLQTFGSQATTVKDDEMPDLVLVDLFLNPLIAPVVEPDNEEADVAAARSVARVRHLLKKEPSIILMSSHGSRGRKEADDYRKKLGDQVYASRFGFVDKGDVKKDAGLGITVEDAARDTLIDIFQTYKFGRALSEAMTRWLAGAKTAVDGIGKDIRALQLKEIAYLVQFRLAAEGQGLEEYLEWFFGEALLDYIIRVVDDAHTKKPLEQDLDPAVTAKIDGGFEPTKSVAKMFHRVRVEGKRTRTRKNFRLGDLYLEKAKGRVVAVMTPDCDLVLRKNEKGKEMRNAEHLLLVPGTISNLEKVSASVGDFMMIDGTPHNIQWVYRRVFSRPFEGTFEKAGQSGKDYQYLGALRPLYAQEIQANLISHVGRVGVAVPPVIGMPAVASISVRTPNGPRPYSFAQSTDFACSLIPGRARDQANRVVFDRDTIRAVKIALVGITTDGLIEEAAESVAALKDDNGHAIEEALKLGPEIGEELSHGIRLTTGKIDGSAESPWCVINVLPVKVPVAQEGVDEAKPASFNEIPAPLAGIVESDASTAAPAEAAPQKAAEPAASTAAPAEAAPQKAAELAASAAAPAETVPQKAAEPPPVGHSVQALTDKA